MEKFVGTCLVIIDQMRKSDGKAVENADEILDKAEMWWAARNKCYNFSIILLFKICIPKFDCLFFSF